MNLPVVRKSDERLLGWEETHCREEKREDNPV
jgi:hypothetical protein